ncbi:hypothetical protein C5748_22410 [Phyllobacterium phragmitis]|uniref:DUF995 domain-containing protein n=1 Tax=Phyllobacterium phragmitis TaxID=2670329 RepID=A0A2S9IL50_9HYPH|nr:DUF995 domain-containing protein [Phyllobacterium phragmitis]PRD41259.1 hypothetical protein C5748_22410 [Phyllobacterium phragmitis]
MSIFRTALMVGAICAGLGAATLGATAAPSKTIPDASKGTPLTSAELYRLYNNRSWLWKDGAGFFSVKQRKFTAWSGKGNSGSYGVGVWFITKPGKLCFRAKWHAKDGTVPALTCFSHRKAGKVVFQKREPDGKWYVFRNAPAKSGDEYAKLRRGNYVSSRLSKIEARLSATR